MTTDPQTVFGLSATLWFAAGGVPGGQQFGGGPAVQAVGVVGVREVCDGGEVGYEPGREGLRGNAGIVRPRAAVRDLADVARRGQPGEGPAVGASCPAVRRRYVSTSSTVSRGSCFTQLPYDFR